MSDVGHAWHCFPLSLHRVEPCVMTPTATVLSWISQVVENPAVLPVPEPGCLHLSPIRGLHRPPTQDLHRSLDSSKDLRLPYSEQPSQAYTNLSAQYNTVAMRDHTYYTTQTMTSWLMVSHTFVGWQAYIRWHRTFVITWHQIFWQLVTSDKCHLSLVGFFLGKIVTKVTLATAPVQQKPFHRCTRTHKIPHLLSFKHSNPHSGSILHDAPHTNASNTNE